MSATRMEAVSLDVAFAADYARTFDDFVRHMRRQGIPVSDRVMEAAHERATQKASEAATARGFRSVNFAPLAASGLALARARFGY